MDFHAGLLPKIGKTTFDVSVVHFLLMFGYKLFSLYYPLFLVSIGLSIIKVGWVYLLIYGTIAASAIAANFLIHKINPAKVAAAGIFGYGVYALLMLFNTGIAIFYAAQILLGISAALWLVSLKSIIIESRPENYNQSFGWFYSAPQYASALAPAIGGLVIYKFGFGGVFALSVFIQFINAFYAYFKLNRINSFDGKTFYSEPLDYARGKRSRNIITPVKAQNFDFKNLKENYLNIFHSLKNDRITSMALAVIFVALILGGIYRPYFVLFLKDLNYTQNDIIGFFSLLSLVFIPISWLAIKFIGKISSYKNISFGVIADGIIFVIIGLWSSFLNLIQVFLLLLVDSIAGLMVGSGKSGMMAEKFAKFKEEASTIDTIIIALGPAIGGIVGGIAISKIGFGATFLWSGAIVLLLSIIFLIFLKKQRR
ncbi:MFS transporter [Patescibacteria group bacterium]|nr:MFS transporter [Patescibacteria group bacterium]MBU4000213.1 MFS transporter [Patescibacteria group bacterium]MBU4056623.1 MFS transporter [Patescibacteria group bacterium]MBU4368650.1 MFS transporter [Patescibacteria group bacterium]